MHRSLMRLMHRWACFRLKTNGPITCDVSKVEVQALLRIWLVGPYHLCRRVLCSATRWRGRRLVRARVRVAVPRRRAARGTVQTKEECDCEFQFYAALILCRPLAIYRAVRRG